MSTRAAHRYAKALLDFARDNHQEQAVQEDMESIIKTLKDSDELASVLQNPTLKSSKKHDILTAVFGNSVSKVSLRLFDLLAENNRMEILHQVADSYRKLYNRMKGIVEATVITAVPLRDDLKEKIMKKAGQIAGGKTIRLTNQTDPSLIGGYILRIGDIQINADIAGKLTELKRNLTK